MDKTSNKIDNFDGDAEVLFAEGMYAVHVTTIYDPILEERMYVYGVYNVQTGVREAETRRLLSAISICSMLGNKPTSGKEATVLDQLEMPFSVN